VIRFEPVDSHWRKSVSEDVPAKRAEHFYSQPFVPAQSSGTGLDSPATIRVAAAAEYAAAQLGVIARKSVEIESHLAKIAAHYPEPGSAAAVFQAAQAQAMLRPK
jgi:hypothetical protein